MSAKAITTDSTVKRKRTIHEFIRWVLSEVVMMEHDGATILGFDDPRDRHEYDWESGGVKTYLNEWRRS
jgi:hypothetical protein